LVHEDEIKDRAERLYVEENLSVVEIAARLEIPAQTIYRWLASAKGRDGFDWDEQKKLFALSPQRLVDAYAIPSNSGYYLQAYIVIEEA